MGTTAWCFIAPPQGKLFCCLSYSAVFARTQSSLRASLNCCGRRLDRIVDILPSPHPVWSGVNSIAGFAMNRPTLSKSQLAETRLARFNQSVPTEAAPNRPESETTAVARRA